MMVEDFNEIVALPADEEYSREWEGSPDSILQKLHENGRLTAPNETIHIRARGRDWW